MLATTGQDAKALDLHDEGVTDELRKAQTNNRRRERCHETLLTLQIYKPAKSTK